MSLLAILLLLAGGLGALIDVTLHFLQLFPRFEPSPAFTSILTIAAGVLMAASCVFAFNLAALVMGLGIAGMAIFSLTTGKEFH